MLYTLVACCGVVLASGSFGLMFITFSGASTGASLLLKNSFEEFGDS